MMKKLSKLITSPAVTVTAFVLAAALLLFSTIGGTRAALTYYSDAYTSRLATYDIGVSLVENGTTVASRNYSSAGDGSWSTQDGSLLQNMIPEGETLHVGQKYDEALAVANTGSINEYVRVSIVRYWLDSDGNKVRTLTPDLIDLNMPGNGWVIDPEASTDERCVLYYTSLVEAGGVTAPLSDTLKIDSAVVNKVTQTESGRGTIVTTYDYDGVQFVIEANVDAVQEHNAEDAILSAWGRSVTVSGGTLSLN